MPYDQIDTVDRALLEALALNSRLSLKQLADLVGLSSPSTAERVRRLEERGIITNFTISVDPANLGYPLQAIVRIRPLPGQLHLVERLIKDTAEFVECDKVTGDDCFFARLVVESMERLDTVLDKIAERATTNTSMVKATTIKRRLPPLDRTGT